MIYEILKILPLLAICVPFAVYDIFKSHKEFNHMENISSIRFANVIIVNSLFWLLISLSACSGVLNILKLLNII